jgi:hypothetical protein
MDLYNTGMSMSGNGSVACWFSRKLVTDDVNDVRLDASNLTILYAHGFDNGKAGAYHGLNRGFFESRLVLTHDDYLIKTPAAVVAISSIVSVMLLSLGIFIMRNRNMSVIVAASPMMSIMMIIGGLISNSSGTKRFFPFIG